MDDKKRKQLYDFYYNSLFEDILPFWLNHSIDREHGGYFTWLDRNGSIYSTDKSVWFQGRAVWIYSKLFNDFGKDKKYLEAAKSGYDFLIKNCFDSDGRLFFQVTREGKPLRKRRYYFSECFAIIAFSEYSKATKSEVALEYAKKLYDIVVTHYKNPEKKNSKINTDTRDIRALSMPMILLATSQALREIDDSKNYDIFIDDIINDILTNYVNEEKKALFETISSNGKFIDIPQGRCVNPGHSIETAWFILEEGKRKKDALIINKALQILDWSLELGWDKEYGGIFYFVDISGRPSEQIEWDMKLWWPHTEALYALLLADILVSDNRYHLWYEKVHEWTFAHFPDKQHKEWYGYLHRDGSISSYAKGSLWKGPFHIPRSHILSLSLLKEN